MSSIASSAHKSPYFCFFFPSFSHAAQDGEERTPAHKNKLNKRVEKSKKEMLLLLFFPNSYAVVVVVAVLC